MNINELIGKFQQVSSDPKAMMDKYLAEGKKS